MKKIKLNKITGIIIISTLTLFLIVSQSQADVDEEFFRFEQEFLLKVEQGYDLLDLYEIKESIKRLYQTDRNKAIILLQDAWDILKQAKLFNASEIYKQVISKKAYKADRFKIILAYEVFGVEVHIVSYYSDNLKQYGVIYKPVNANERIPLVAYNHGGFKGCSSHDEWFLRFCRENNYAICIAVYRAEPLAVPLTLIENAKVYEDLDQYPDKGSVKVFMCEGKFEGLKGEVDDILNLIECAKTLSFVDTKRIGMIGGSHGGGNAVLCLTRSKDIKAGVTCAGVLNAFRWHNMYMNSGTPQYYVQLSFKEQMEYMLERSALHVAEYVTVPLLLIVGDADTPHIYKMNLDFIEKMTILRDDFEYIIYPDEVHGFYFGHPVDPILPKEKWMEDMEDAYQNIVLFFKKHL